MVRVLGVVDEEPFDPKTWSGSSKYFFDAMSDRGVLAGAISADISSPVRMLHKLKNFSTSLRSWKFNYHHDTAVFDSMTHSAGRRIKEDVHSDFDVVLQIGAWYDLPSVTSKPVVSYHDGNLARRMHSPFVNPAASISTVAKAMRYERALYAKMRAIFPMSDWLAGSFVGDFDVPANRVFPVGAGINLPFIKPTTGRSYEKPTVLMVGKDFERKGGATLIKAFAVVKREIPDARLVLVGPMLDNLPDGVECLGFVDKSSPDGLKTLLNLYSESAVFALPSLYEPFGISFAEAMAHRLPCVGTRSCAMPEIISDGITGVLVPPGEVIPLANALIDLLKSQEQCRIMGEAGFQKYSANFTWSVVTRKIVEVLDSVV